jgi:hypothetical protein
MSLYGEFAQTSATTVHVSRMTPLEACDWMNRATGRMTRSRTICRTLLGGWVGIVAEGC